MAQVVNMTTPVYSGTKTAKLISAADAAVATAGSVTRATNGAWYACSFSGVTQGAYVCQLYEDGTAVATLPVYIDAANGTWGDTHSELLRLPRAAAAIPSGECTWTNQDGDTTDVTLARANHGS